MDDVIFIPPYDVLVAMYERNKRERYVLEALLRLRSKDSSDSPIRIPVPADIVKGEPK